MILPATAAPGVDGITLVMIPAPEAVGPERAPGTGIDHVYSQRGGEWSAGHESGDAIDLPSSECSIHEPVAIRHKLLSFPKRKFVDIAHHQPVPDIEVGER